MNSRTKQILQQTQDELDRQIEEVRRKRNEEDRKYIVSQIGQDLAQILIPLLEMIANNSRMTKQEMMEVLKEIKVESPQVKVEPAQIKVDAPEIPKIEVPKIEFPKNELVKTIREAITKVKFPKIEIPKVEMPKEIKVAKFEQLLENIEKIATARLKFDLGEINRDNPLPVILTDEDGNFYKAIMQAISTGGGKGIGALKIDGDGHLQVDVLSGGGGGTQYADGAVRGTATGTLAMGDDGVNIQSLKCDANGELQIDILSLPASVIAGMTSLPAGTNNIGDVDIASIAAGNNNIGDVDVASIAAGTNIIGQIKITDGTDLALVDSSGNLMVNLGVKLAASTDTIEAVPTDYELAGNTLHVNKYYTSAGAVTDGIIWSPAAGKRWYVTDIFINVSAAATVTLEDDLAAGDNAVWKAELAANSGWSHSFTTPLFSREDAADLIITTSAGNVYVMVTGYEV